MFSLPAYANDVALYPGYVGAVGWRFRSPRLCQGANKGSAASVRQRKVRLRFFFRVKTKRPNLLRFSGADKNSSEPRRSGRAKLSVFDNAGGTQTSCSGTVDQDSEQRLHTQLSAPSVHLRASSISSPAELQWWRRGFLFFLRVSPLQIHNADISFPSIDIFFSFHPVFSHFLCLSDCVFASSTNTLKLQRR